MMNQIYSNSSDPIKGRPAADHVLEPKEYGFFTISGNLGTQYPQAWAGPWPAPTRATTDRRRLHRRRRHGGGRLPQRADLRGGLPGAGDPQHRQQPVGHLELQGIAGGEHTTFAAKGIAYGLPTLRVDGNDFLAVYAATQWRRSGRARTSGRR
jgi:2-oxoisovalerate dehydrogenase E1 component alpha subunit